MWMQDKKFPTQPGVLMHTCNPGTQDANAGGWGVRDQPGLHCETLSQKNKQIRNHGLLLKKDAPDFQRKSILARDFQGFRP
jgi:hypothetical protein